MTIEQARAIITANQNKKGRKTRAIKEAEALLGITPTIKTLKKDNRVHNNDNVSDNEKWRYIRIAQIRDILSTNISSNAHFLLMTLFTSPYSNSLGIFKMSLNDMVHQTGGDLSKTDIINALNELTAIAEVRYHNGYIYLTNFLSNQKTHGNKNNLIGVIKKYNELPTENKLPYLNEIQYGNMSMNDLIIAFEKIKRGIECMGVIASGRAVVVDEYADIYTQEKLTEIVVNRKMSLIDTLVTLQANAVVIESLQRVERSIEPVTVTDEEQEVFFPAIEEPVMKKEEVQEDEETLYEDSLSNEEYLEYINKGGYTSVISGDNRSNVIPPQQEEKKKNIVSSLPYVDDSDLFFSDEKEDNNIIEEEKVEEKINIPKMNYTSLDNVKEKVQEDILTQPIQEEFSPEVNNIFEQKQVTVRQVVSWFSKLKSCNYDLLIDAYKNDKDFEKEVNKIVRELKNNGKMSFSMFCDKYQLPLPAPVIPQPTSQPTFDTPEEEVKKRIIEKIKKEIKI